MERGCGGSGGGSGERSRVLTQKEKRDELCKAVMSFEKKRPKVVVSESESSEEFMKPPARSVKTSKEKFARKKDGRNGFVRRNKESSGMKKLDVFEFDEYDGFDSANLMRKRFDNGTVGVSGRVSFPPRRFDNGVVGGGSGSGREGLFVRRKKPYLNGACSGSLEEKLSSESDSDEAIRVQGRNGVLKVKVNNKTSTLPAPIQHHEAERPPSSSRKAQKREDVKAKPSFRKPDNMENYSESEESDVERKAKRRKPVCGKSKKETDESLKPAAREERRGMRNGGTEKQRLREKIKGMLTDAGWTIDYRPRRNQTYLDTVYVNPSGIAFWSIIKAYDAFRQQLKEEDIDARSRKDVAAVVSVSEDIVNNLARKVKKTGTEISKKRDKGYSDSESEKQSYGEGVDSDTFEERFVKMTGKSIKRGRNDLHSKSKRPSYYNDARPSSGSDSHYLDGRLSKKIGRCTLKVRSSEDKKSPEANGFNPYSGKRTLLSWLIDCGVVQVREKVQYMNHQCTKVMLEGWVTRAGIHCACCSKILTISRFEIHAGSKSCQPFQNIYLESGSSLLHCQIRAWNMQKGAKNLGFHRVDADGDDPHDDACGICGDGGDLLCCDGCPSTYHQACLGIEVLPVGDWHCPNCTCKFCDAVVHSGGEEENPSLLSCNMCERKYHQSCMNELEAHNVQSSASSFCGPKCLELFEKLKKYLGVKHEIEGGYSWSLIHRVDTDSKFNSQLSAQRIENNSKLAVGLAIMDECFLPIIDRRSGINLIRNVLYNCGSNFNRINYTGFYTAILERGDEIICAASLRFHGMQLAEMPFIGTRHIYRRQGMCRRLFDAIESAMRSLKVEKLVIPAIPDFLHAWTGNFGFSPLDDSVRKEMRSLNTLVFPGIDMLQKPLLLHEENKSKVAAEEGDCVVVVPKGAMNSEIEPEKKSESASFAETCLNSNGYVADDDDVDCVKKTLVSHEKSSPPICISVETSKPEGEESGISSSSCQFTLKSCSTQRGNNTGSSCEDVNVEAVAKLLSLEIVQASTEVQIEDNLASSISGLGSSDMSSISQEDKSEQKLPNREAFTSCKDNDRLGPDTKLAVSKAADGLLL
ncbi:increased DNA methylation 1 [Raphanus sativus]|uniref:Increased DNA methylation 1 n=1 Tax=Raphanus sativus TaxID=3726 RepID=A0A6J0JMY6_RAPSA|nr:increased DNA methylation 1 [Raphanus sativus]